MSAEKGEIKNLHFFTEKLHQSGMLFFDTQRTGAVHHRILVAAWRAATDEVHGNHTADANQAFAAQFSPIPLSKRLKVPCPYAFAKTELTAPELSALLKQLQQRVKNLTSADYPSKALKSTPERAKQAVTTVKDILNLG
ncbi:MAG: hypothetical protein EB059_03875 [Alphaproteobacteria bacterium]|nr:hypothetical protein [Alphaproteobacteria bacterium]